jgi:hypothetical protein
MITKVIKVGKGRHQSEQVVTNTFTTEADGQVREHVTLSTPEPITDTQRMRLMTYREEKQSWQK